ncbi:hypothetical protein TSOC_009803 [Tetrabaena socialis]|uniref:MYND-type domain-containing protein n=1 Tax=Tetrabaena socialis TaxID=47790 RepID=A0A2J7ZUW3_9CHLO|nr:hypothetical protein TSOC_009803 [Tetrabaena socialis]|eukprot:PNH04067.1 hypothetical protein TSOC_009803 [Tetrabaena socialis]
MCNACDVFSLAALVANYAVIDSGGREGDAPGPASTAAAVDRQRGLLAALRGSGLLSALSAAVLAAPLSPEVASDSVELDDVTGIMFHAQHQLFGVLQALTMAIVPGPLLCTARELLAAPDVQQLRWAALEQLAAAAPAAAASTYAAADAGMSLRTGASGSGGGDGGGARGEAGGRWKPMLLQPRVVRLHPVLGGKRMCTLDIMLEAIIGCCHTLSAEVEAELRRLAACANDDTAGPATETWSHRACEAVALQAAYVAQATSAITAGCSADFVDLLLPEAIVWALRAQMAVMEVDGVAPAAWTASPSSNGAKAAELASSLAYRLHGWTSFSPAKQAAYVQRLLPTGLMGSLDRLLRHLAATGLQTEGERDAVGACAFLMAHLAPPMLRIPLAATPGGAGDSGGGGWRPQDKLGPLLTLAKLARREASQPGGPSLDAPSSAAGLEPHLARAIAGGLVAGAEQLTALLDSLTPPPPLAQREGALGGDRATCAEASSAGAAVREAVALASGTALPLLEWLVARELAGAGGGGGGGGGRRRVGGSGAAGLPPSALADHSAMTMPPLRVSDIPGCYRGIKVLVRCLAAAVQLLPPADLLALQPQRTLALLGRLLQRAHELRRPGARQGGRGGGGRGMGAGAEETEPTRLAGEVAGALVRMAADEELVGAVAGWLGGEVVEGQQQQPQPLRGGLGARVLAAALQSWDGAAAGEVMSFYAAATAAGAPRAKAGGEGGGSNSRGPEAAASGGGATAPLLAAARAAIALRPETTLWGLRGGGAGGIPAWPPRVLRLCSNPGCLNFAGASNGTLPLRKCSGCKGVRYCGAGCQQQHWRSHREECAGRKAAARAVGGDD